MKKYFAKYLPIEGEIKEGDNWIDDLNHLRQHSKFNSHIPIPVNNPKKVKLSLCSRDIQVGEYFTQEGVDTYNSKIRFFCEEKTEHEGDLYLIDDEGHTFVLYNKKLDKWLCHKVIGEISPNAVWVKEGDEFDEEQTTYNPGLATETELLRRDFEKRTGLTIGSWVQDSEDGYKKRYQGTIYNFTSLGGRLQIHYGCIGTFGGGSWGYEDDIKPMEPNGYLPVGSKYGKAVIKIECPICKTFH